METEQSLANLTVRIIFNEEMRPDRFFVRSPQQSLKFDAMDSSLQNHFKNPNMDRFDGSSSPQLQNNDVMACFVEERYFRCKFLGIEQNMPKVFLIDMGEILKVPFDSCYAIPLRFAHLKPCALLCHLNIVPKVGKSCSLRLDKLNMCFLINFWHFIQRMEMFGRLKMESIILKRLYTSDN